MTPQRLTATIEAPAGMTREQIGGRLGKTGLAIKAVKFHKRGRRALAPEIIAEIKRLAAEGQTQRVIAEALGVATGSVAKAVATKGS